MRPLVLSLWCELSLKVTHEITRRQVGDGGGTSDAEDFHLGV